MPVVPPKNLTAENLAKMAKESAPYLSHAEPLTARESAAAVDAYKKYINSIKDLTAGDINLSKISKKLQTDLTHFSNSIKKLEEAMSRGGRRIPSHLLELKGGVAPILGEISKLGTTVSARQERPMFSALYNSAIISAAQKQQREHERIQRSQQIERERAQRRATRLAEIEQTREDNRNKRNETSDARRRQREIDRNNRQQERDEARAKIAEAKFFTQRLKEQQIIKNRDSRVANYIASPTTSLRDMIFGGTGRFGHHAQNISGIKKLLMGASIGAVAAGGGGMIGAPLIGALLATALGFPELAPVGALGGVVYDVGKDLWGGAKAINHSMDPFANQAVNLSKAANVMGISFADLVKTYGGSKHALNKISPMFSGLGVMPTDIPSLASAYGMSFRHQRAMRLAAAAPWAPYLGFQGPHEWAGFQQHMLGMGYGAGYGGLEGLFSGLTRSIRDALKGLVPPQQTYENINRYLEMLAKTGQILPYDYARRQAMLGATSVNPAARLGLPQAQAGAAWSGALGGAAGSPLYYTSLLAATQKATGSTTLNYSNLLKLGKSLGVPISPMSSVQQRALNWAATNLPIATPALLNSFGVPGDLLMRAMLSTIGGATTSKAGRDVWTALTAPHGAGLGTLMKINPAYAGPTLSGKIRQPKWPHLLFPMIAHKMGYSFAIRGTGVSGEPSMPIVPTNLLKEEYAWFLKNSSIMASQLDASAGALHDFVGTVGHATSALQKLVDVLSGMFVGVAVSPWNPTPAHGTGATSVGGAATSGSSRGVPGSSAPPGVPAAPPAVMIR